MIRNKGVTKSFRELWRQYLKLSIQERKKDRSQVTEISQRKREIAMGLVVDNPVTWQGWSV